MQSINEENPNHWTEVDREGIVGLFDLLLQMNKNQNHNLNNTIKLKEGTVIDSIGREVTL